MKTRKYLHALALLWGAGVTLGACDMLETEPTSVITSSSFWKTEADAEGALAGMYVQLRNNTNENLFIWGEMRSETLESEAIVGDNYKKYRDNDLDPSFGPTWQNFYAAINTANLLLRKVPDIHFTDEGNRDRILAQAHATRAYVYFTMARIWGGVPLRTEPLENYDPVAVQKARASEDSVFLFVKQDLEDALALFPDSDFETGRNHWSKASTFALKADVYLWTARRLGGGTADYTTALAACDSVERIKTTNGGIELLPNFSDVFAYENKGNNEVLMAVNYRANEASNNYFDMMHISEATFTPDIRPDQLELIEAGGGLMEDSPSRILREQYEEGDSRAAGTFLEIEKNIDGTYQYYGTMAMKCRGTVISGVRYFVDDIILYRYADVLLMKAEAKNGLGQDIAPEMNAIRQRAFGDNSHDYSNGSFEENDEAILKERLLEFALECKRWFDLVRFDKAFELVPALQERAYDPEWYYWPIPSSVISLEPLVEQNEAWK